MSVTYIHRDTISDLSVSGAIFNHKLLEETATEVILDTGAIAPEAEVSGYAFTEAGVPGADGITGTYVVELNITTGDADLRYSAQVARVDSAGAVQSESSLSEEQAGEAGLKTFTFTDLNLGTWASGDRLRIRYRFRNSRTHPGNRTAYFTTNTTNDEVVTPFTAGAPPVEGGSEAVVNITAEGAGQKSASGGAESTIQISAEGSGSKITGDSAESAVTISSEGVGSKGINAGSDSTVNISGEGSGNKQTQSGSDSIINVQSEGAGQKSVQGGSEATVNVIAEGEGEVSQERKEGGSEVSVNVVSEGSGIKQGRFGSDSEVFVIPVGVGVKEGVGGEDSLVLVYSEGQGIKEGVVILVDGTEHKHFVYEIVDKYGARMKMLKLGRILSTVYNE